MEAFQDVEINNQNFWEMLPDVLEAISLAEVVALDLEMTGVRVKKGLSDLTDKHTLESYYQAAVEVANTFQILEVGMTCLRYETERIADAVANQGAYAWKTFNFRIAPWYLGSDSANMRLANFLDRSFTLSNCSTVFFNNSRSDGLPLQVLKDGITFLSREESQEAYDCFIDPERQERKLVNISKEKPAIRQFCDNVRREIENWLGDRHADSFLNIENPHADRLTSFQIRIISQILETDFAGDNLRGITKCGREFIQIIRKGVNRFDAKIVRDRIRERKAAVREQTGFRVVFEALVGGDFAREIDPTLLQRGLNAETSVAALEEKLQKIEQQAKSRNRIIVGHNSLFDLCFLYRSFVGTLPSTLEQFKVDLDCLFPRIVDTKHMATDEDYSIVPELPLAQLYATLKDQAYPRVHSTHAPIKVAHQAGYDSWLTAMVFLKLAWRLSQNTTLLSRLRSLEASGEVEAGDMAKLDISETTSALRPSRFVTYTPQFPPESLQPSPVPQPTRRQFPASLDCGPSTLDYGPSTAGSAPSLDRTSEITPMTPGAEAKNATGRREDDEDGEEDDGRLPEWNSELFNVVGGKIRSVNQGVISVGSHPKA